MFSFTKLIAHKFPWQMSPRLESSPKHCAKQGVHIEKLYKRLAYIFSSTALSILFTIFLVWIILHPSNPQFSLKEANIYHLDLARDTHLLNSSIQATFVARNPNKKVAVYYDQLQAYASYKDQQITTQILLPGFYQGHEDTNLISASLIGNWVPVAATFGYEVSHDQVIGKMEMNLKLNGRLRWKVGTWISNYYHLHVDCVAVLELGPNSLISTPYTTNQAAPCSTNV